jgi:hypothetical protein
MFKFIRGLVLWQVMRNNIPVVKKLIIAALVFLISLYFFPDWEDYFIKKNNLNMLLYTKLTKYFFLAGSSVSFILNIKKLSLLGAKEKLEKDKGLNLNLEPFDIDDPDIEKIRSKKNLRSQSDIIKEKYKENE